MTERPDAPLFFLIAGEASGDLIGARLMRALKARTEGRARFAGIGGPRMQAEGIVPLFPQSELAHFGLIELLRHVPHLYRRIRETATAIGRMKPVALITIDAPDFCFRVAKRVKAAGFPVPLIHYVAPTVWVWRKGRAKKVARFLDHLLTLLPFEPPYFTKEGLATTFVGHPILESGAKHGDGLRFRMKHNIAAGTELIAVLPGSRRSEISRLMPVFGKALGLLKRQHAHLHAVIPAAPGFTESLRAQSKDWPVPVTIIEGDNEKYDAFAGSRIALACSGTVAIELALARLPSITVYKLNLLTALLYGPFVRGTFANLVNIMHKRKIVPELLQFNCTPEKIAGVAHTLLSSEAARQQQKEGLASIARWLGEGQFVPSERAAETVLAAVKDYRKSPPPLGGGFRWGVDAEKTPHPKPLPPNGEGLS